jgi:hypothetical protein
MRIIVTSARWVGLASALGLLLAIAACGHTSGDAAVGDAGDGGADTSGCMLLFDAVTAYAARCGEPSFYGDRERFGTYCRRVVDAPGATDANRALAACASTIASATQACDDSSFSSTECTTMTGTRPSGTPCAADAQCKSGWCKGASSLLGNRDSSGAPAALACGTCTDEIPVHEACGSPADRCTEGPCVCFPSGAGTNGCNCLGSLGASNSRHSDLGGPCTGDSECVVPNVCHAGKCAVPLLDGAPCLDSESARSGGKGDGCARTAMCDIFTPMRCVTRITGGSGHACDGVIRTCRVGTCVHTNPSTSFGTCSVVIPDGQPCDPNDQTRTCDEFAQCIGGTCVGFDPGACR